MAEQDPWEKAGVSPSNPWDRDQPVVAQQGPVMEGMEQLGVGMMNAAQAIAGAPGDALQALDTAQGAAEDFFGVKGRLPRISQALSFATPFPMPKTTGQIKAATESLTGKPPEPTGLIGETAKSIGEFWPMVFGGEAALMPRIARAVFAGLGSEAGGKAASYTMGKDWEDIGRLAGAMTPQTLAFMWKQTPDRMLGAIDHLFEKAGDGYKNPAVKDLQIKTPVVQAEAVNIANQMYADGFRETDAKGTASALAELVFGQQPKSVLSNPVKSIAAGSRPKPYISIDDISSVRNRLNAIAGNYNDPVDQKWAMDALQRIDEWLPKLSQNDILKGDVAKATSILKDAKGDYWGAKSLELLGDQIYKADLQAGSTWSGQNLDNAVRQKVRSILTNDKMRNRYTDREIERMEQIVKGAPIQNLMRRVSKMIPRTGVMGSLMGGASVEAFGAKGLAIPAAGEVAASIENKLANKLVRDLQDEIINRTPQGKAGYRAPRNSTMSPVLPGMLELGAQQAPDGNWYLPDPERPGKYLQVNP